jgi:hypothetical protein
MKMTKFFLVNFKGLGLGLGLQYRYDQPFCRHATAAVAFYLEINFWSSSGILQLCDYLFMRIRLNSEFFAWLTNLVGFKTIIL